MNQDEEHLRLLSIFHYVCAGMIALLACFPIIHLVVGIAMVAMPRSFGHGSDQPPAIVGWLFIAVASAIILSGWSLAGLIAWGGRCLARRVRYTFCQVVAGFSCVFMPAGTVLGVFTLLVLTRPSVKALFGTSPQSAVAA